MAAAAPAYNGQISKYKYKYKYKYIRRLICRVYAGYIYMQGIYICRVWLPYYGTAEIV